MLAGAAIRLKESFKPPRSDQSLFGQLQEITHPGVVRVNLMVKDGVHLKLGSVDDLVTVSACHIAEHANIDDVESLRAHRMAWKTLGLRLVNVSDTEADTFVRINGVPANAMVMLGNVEESDSEDDEEGRLRPGLCGYDSDDGFVVADEDTCPFTLADPEASEFVADTHDAVLGYDTWVPSSEGGKRFRAWIEAFEQKVAHVDDDAQFANGTHVNYARPPKRRKRGK